MSLLQGCLAAQNLAYFTQNLENCAQKMETSYFLGAFLYVLLILCALLVFSTHFLAQNLKPETPPGPEAQHLEVLGLHYREAASQPNNGLLIS